MGDEHFVPADRRDDRVAEQKRELAGEDTDLALTDDATLEQLEATLDRLRQLGQRIEQRELEPGDWAVLSAVIRETM